jgi:hypothetical protein
VCIKSMALPASSSVQLVPNVDRAKHAARCRHIGEFIHVAGEFEELLQPFGPSDRGLSHKISGVIKKTNVLRRLANELNAFAHVRNVIAHEPGSLTLDQVISECIKARASLQQLKLHLSEYYRVASVVIMYNMDSSPAESNRKDISVADMLASSGASRTASNKRMRDTDSSGLTLRLLTANHSTVSSGCELTS